MTVAIMGDQHRLDHLIEVLRIYGIGSAYVSEGSYRSLRLSEEWCEDVLREVVRITATVERIDAPDSTPYAGAPYGVHAEHRRVDRPIAASRVMAVLLGGKREHRQALETVARLGDAEKLAPFILAACDLAKVATHTHTESIS